MGRQAVNLVELDSVQPQKEFMSHSLRTSLPLRMPVCPRGCLLIYCTREEKQRPHQTCVYFWSHYMMTFFITFCVNPQFSQTFCTEIDLKLWFTQTLQHDLGILYATILATCKIFCNILPKCKHQLVQIQLLFPFPFFAWKSSYQESLGFFLLLSLF